MTQRVTITLTVDARTLSIARATSSDAEIAEALQDKLDVALRSFVTDASKNNGVIKSFQDPSRGLCVSWTNVCKVAQVTNASVEGRSIDKLTRDDGAPFVAARALDVIKWLERRVVRVEAARRAIAEIDRLLIASR